MAKHAMEDMSMRLAGSEEELQSRLNHYYVRLAEVESISDGDREQLYAEVKAEIASLKNTASCLRESYQSILASLDELEARLHDVEASRRKHLLLPPAPANSVIDLQEQRKRHFAQGLNIYKLMLVCVIGSFAGVVVELLWCFIRNGYFESRSGLVYGPFNLLYGVGAAALTLALYKYRNHSSIISFAGGMLVGSVVEYVCSWGQEMLFGSRSWDYSNFPLNLNGRICLLYSVFWGFLGVMWIKNIYPRMAKAILHLPNRAGKILTWALVLFLTLDAAVTLGAMDRWAERLKGEAPQNAVEEIIDEHFPNERMEHVFANMIFKE